VPRIHSFSLVLVVCSNNAFSDTTH
jgi:hypothetical protein